MDGEGDKGLNYLEGFRAVNRVHNGVLPWIGNVRRAS